LPQSSDSNGSTSCKIPPTPHVHVATSSPSSFKLTTIPRGWILPVHLDIHRVPLRRNHDIDTSHQASVRQAAFQTPAQRNARDESIERNAVIFCHRAETTGHQGYCLMYNTFFPPRVYFGDIMGAFVLDGLIHCDTTSDSIAFWTA
jgi:hypothetical protein